MVKIAECLTTENNTTFEKLITAEYVKQRLQAEWSNKRSQNRHRSYTHNPAGQAVKHMFTEYFLRGESVGLSWNTKDKRTDMFHRHFD